MRIRENERKSRLKISELSSEIFRTISFYLEDNEMSYHELQAVLINVMNSNNGYALRHELGIEDDD